MVQCGKSAQMQTKTAIGTLSGVFVDPLVPELWLGHARVYRNPFWSGDHSFSHPSPNFDMCSPDGSYLEAAKFLVDVEFKTETAAMTMESLSDRLESAVLPLRLGTAGRILVTFARLGSGPRDVVSAKGVHANAPLPTGKHPMAALDESSCEHLSQFAQTLEHLDLTGLKIPLELFSDSFYRSRPVDRGIDLLVALEALFSEGPESISLKVALRTSCFLATESTKRKRIFGIVRDAYKHRNVLVHGTDKRPKAVAFFEKHDRQLEAIVRQSLCQFVRLLESGTNLEPKNIDDFLFDSKLLEAPKTSGIDGFQSVG